MKNLIGCTTVTMKKRKAKILRKSEPVGILTEP